MKIAKVYIAGPYTKPDPEANTYAMMKVWDELRSLGYFPFCPLWSHFQEMRHPRTWEDWMQFDLAWIDVCDCVLRIPGESVGADREIAHAKKECIPVYHSIEELQLSEPIR